MYVCMCLRMHRVCMHLCVRERETREQKVLPLLDCIMQCQNVQRVIFEQVFTNFAIISSPRFELPATDVQQKDGKKLIITCHYCGETGHKAMYCNKMPPEMKEAQGKQEDFRVGFHNFVCFITRIAHGKQNQKVVM